MNFKIIIQARLGSKRLPEKMLLPFFRKLSLLEVVILNLLEDFNKSDIILATSNNNENDKLVDICNKLGIESFKGSEQDVLSRFQTISVKKEIDFFIRACGDNPFIQNDKIKNLIKEYQNNEFDYISYKILDKPSIKTHSGFYTELVKTSALFKIKKEKKYNEHVTNYIYENPHLFKLKFINEENDHIINNIRLTVDTLSDFNLCSKIYEKNNNNKGIFNILNILTNEDLNIMRKNIIENEK